MTHDEFLGRLGELLACLPAELCLVKPDFRF